MSIANGGRLDIHQRHGGGGGASCRLAMKGQFPYAGAVGLLGSGPTVASARGAAEGSGATETGRRC